MLTPVSVHAIGAGAGRDLIDGVRADEVGIAGGSQDLPGILPDVAATIDEGDGLSDSDPRFRVPFGPESCLFYDVPVRGHDQYYG